MGSHKKHSKERKRHKHSSRSRSRSRSPANERRKRKHEENNIPEQEEYHRSQHSKRIKQVQGGENGDQGVGEQFQESLGVSETNSLRAKLGLKPLDVEEDQLRGETKEGLKTYKIDGQEFVHAPPSSITTKKKTEKIREKLTQTKEKREIVGKLKKIKGLGESDSEDESAASWVDKNRQQQQLKAEAEKRAKILEEMDEELGIGDLVEDEMKTAIAKSHKSYTGRHLAGLKVGHAKESFMEGSGAILTLADKDVLDDGGDTLINVNMIDREKADKNIEKRKKKPQYQAYDDGEVDEYGQIKVRDILEKYDEEIDGEKLESFVLGRGGHASLSDVKEEEKMKQDLRMRAESLELRAPTVPSAYYTEQEMVKFKKVGKKKKIRKRKILKADDLAPLHSSIPGLGNSDHTTRRAIYEVDGDEDEVVIKPPKTIETRGKKGKSSKQLRVKSDEDNYEVADMDIDNIPEAEQTELLGPDEDLTGIKVEEEDDDTLTSLMKAKKLKRSSKVSSRDDKLSDIVSSVRVKREGDGDEAGTHTSIILNNTSEFCRTLGDIPTYGMAGNRDDMDEDELLDFERELMEERKKQFARESGENQNNWMEIREEEEDMETTNIEDDAHFMDEEPTIGTSVASALRVAHTKGYVEKEPPRRNAAIARTAHLQAQVFTVEERSLEDKFSSKQPSRDRFSVGPITEFKDKDGYNPEVKIEYPDEHGRMMGPKEAFRYLSHRFHGKASGKMKTEKRNRKLQEEQIMKKMSSTDTPLETLSKLKDQQKKLQTPYVVLSGGKGAGGGDVGHIAKNS